jgi:hypothetical protein
MIRITTSRKREIELTSCEFKDLVHIARNLSVDQVTQVYAGTPLGIFAYGCVEVRDDDFAIGQKVGQ